MSCFQESTQGENAPSIETWCIIYQIHRVTQSMIFMFFPLCKIALYVLLSLLNDRKNWRQNVISNFHLESPDAQGFQLVEFSFRRAAFCPEVFSLSCASSGIVLQVGSIILNYFHLIIPYTSVKSIKRVNCFLSIPLALMRWKKKNKRKNCITAVLG